MQISGRAASCFAVLLATLACASAVQKLTSISSLKKIQFGKTVPKHCLILLHWFANEIEFDNNNIMRLTFDPNGDYGSHHYGNYEGILVPVRRGCRYYTIGNLNQETTVPLPDYVMHPRRDYGGENRDRIILSASQQVIHQVFITQHYETWQQQGTLYDPNHTYQITTALLREIREFSIRDNNLPLLYLRNRYQSNADMDHLKQTWGNLACLGLFLAIVIKETHTPRQGNNRHSNTPGRLPSYTPGHNNRSPSIRHQSTRSDDILIDMDNDNTPANCSCPLRCILVSGCISIFVFGVVIALLIHFLK